MTKMHVWYEKYNLPMDSNLSPANLVLCSHLLLPKMFVYQSVVIVHMKNINNNTGTDAHTNKTCSFKFDLVPLENSLVSSVT